jgi:predicted PhzF superfamily epimerase YddE/YHI9
MPQVRVLRVFTDEHARHGNPLGVVLDPGGLGPDDRQALATRLGYSETVFVDDSLAARVQLFTPATEIRFAGHPLVGVSWLLAHESGQPPSTLRPVRVATPVATFVVDGITWIRGSVADAPAWEHVQLASPAEVAAVDPAAVDGIQRKTQVWAWIDEAAGTVRARTFAQDFGVPEDEACGSATLMLAGRTGRHLTVHHGKGSVVLARPMGAGTVEVGGRVADDGTVNA